MSKPAIYLSLDRFYIWISNLTSRHDVCLETVNPLALAPEMGKEDQQKDLSLVESGKRKQMVDQSND
ncbi:hypothetical protein DPMN_043081 [Dreissena polymorpha]|uniref:Uncharacterized protein n=1 Tax=Dreissena polymorpha TaxID=45954 RepID=A0A9D4HZB9_DREPO|nr:hypothetical protein DPMN_043081 [Dreissena polymorpha]